MRNARGAFAWRCWATAARAARPASLASSARTEVLEASHSQASTREAQPKTIEARSSIQVVSGAATFRVRSFHSRSAQGTVRVGSASNCRKSLFCKAWTLGKETRALRRSAKPNTRGRAATSFARGGSFGLFAGGATQRTMRAGCAAQAALPNPSIERTNNGGSSFTAFANAQPPLFASHLKR